MAKITIIVGHSRRDTYCEFLGQCYKRGAESAGHQVSLFVLSRLSFDPILKEAYDRPQILEPDLQTAYHAMKTSNHFVIVFPLWCGDMPAILKGFIERILQPDLVALQQKAGRMGLNLRIFSKTSARIIMTMGMPALFYRLYFHAHALKLLQRNILQFIGVRPVHNSLLGMVHDERRRDKFMGHVEELGRRAA